LITNISSKSNPNPKDYGNYARDLCQTDLYKKIEKPISL
jgi:hypothetical protein